MEENLIALLDTTYSGVNKLFAKLFIRSIFTTFQSWKNYLMPLELVAVFLKKKIYKLLILQSIEQLNLASEHIEQLRKGMDSPPLCQSIQRL